MPWMSKRKPVTPSDLESLVSVGSPRLSPDGSQVLYTHRIVDDNRNNVSIWLADATRKRRPRSLTSGGKDSMPRWSPDGCRVAFVRGGDEGSQIYLLEMAGGDAMQLTAFDEGSISALEWSPAGDQLAVSYRRTLPERTHAAAEQRKESKESDPPLVTEDLWYRLDGDGFFGTARYGLHLVDVESGSHRPLWTKDNLGFFSFAWSPRGSKIAITTNTDKRALVDARSTRIVIADVETGKAATLPNLPRGPKTGVQWSPNGRYLAWAGREGEDASYSSENLELFVASAITGKAKSLTSGLDRCLMTATLADTGDVSFDPAIRWTGDSNSLLVQIGWHGEAHICRIPRKGGSLTPLTSGHAVHMLGNISRDGRRVAIIRSMATEPPEIFVGRLGARSLTLAQVTHENTQWCKDHATSSPRQKWIRSEDGTRIHCWIMPPPQGVKSSRPAVLQIHGGPHAQYGWAFFHEFQCLASAGYTVVYANPRGSKGYGRDHCAAIRNDWGGADWVDMQAVIAMMEKLPGVNRRNMGVMGGSYGGYMTNWIVGHTDVFRAAITDRCVSNLVSMGGNSDFPDKEDGFFGGNFWSRPEDRWRQSPIRHFGNVTTPMLIIHSEGDLRCNIEQGEEVFAALRLQGVVARFVRYPRSTSHGFSRGGAPDMRLHRLGEILRWWKQYLR